MQSPKADKTPHHEGATSKDNQHQTGTRHTRWLHQMLKQQQPPKPLTIKHPTLHSQLLDRFTSLKAYKISHARGIPILTTVSGIPSSQIYNQIYPFTTLKEGEDTSSSSCFCFYIVVACVWSKPDIYFAVLLQPRTSHSLVGCFARSVFMLGIYMCFDTGV